MKYQLINQPKAQYSAIQQILFNRGIAIADIPHYLNLSKKDVYSPKMLGQAQLQAGLLSIINAVKKEKDALIIVDCDCDGYTSAALLINYLYKMFPSWVLNHISWYMHEGKQHGLSDCISVITNRTPTFDLVICPDSSSNDYEYHEKLKNNGISVLVLDHHLADKISENAIIINNQLSDYPNKELSGVGVVWQFCRYIDSMCNTNYSNDLLDLVALGLCGDMMSLKSFETRYLISEGFKKNNIKNPFIDYMLEKNTFPLSKTDYKSSDSETSCTSIGAAFFIVPFVNAITRSGTMEEKHLLFKAMLEHQAFKEIDSNKRGHAVGEKEKLILQAIRTATNVKNRQTRAEEAGLAMLEKMIQSKNMLNHKILLFLLEQNQIDPEIRGLIANKFMAKYQRPCCLLTHTSKGTYEGSMRGYTKTGIDSFKQILEKCPEVIYVQGHDNAAGVGIKEDQIDNFLIKVDTLLNDFTSEPIYRIDYDFRENDNNNDKILEIAQMNDFWGQDIDRSYVNMRFKITNKNFQIMKGNTFKFVVPNGLSIIKFNGSEEQVKKFSIQFGYLEINAICKCNINEWNNNIYPQLIIEDYEIIDSSKYFF